MGPCEPIKHAYHGDCLKNWLKNNDECPNCRTSPLGMEGNKVKKVSRQDELDKYIQILKEKRNHFHLKVLTIKMAANGVVVEIGQRIMEEAISVVQNNGELCGEAVETLHKRAIEENERYHMNLKRKRKEKNEKL